MGVGNATWSCPGGGVSISPQGGGLAGGKAVVVVVMEGGGGGRGRRQSAVFILIRDAPRVLSLSGEDARLVGSGGADAAALRLRWRRST